MAVHPDGAAVHIVKPHQQVDHCGFAAAGRPYQGHPLARLHMEIQILNQRILRNIGKIHVVQIHPALSLF